MHAPFSVELIVWVLCASIAIGDGSPSPTSSVGTRGAVPAANNTCMLQWLHVTPALRAHTPADNDRILGLLLLFGEPVDESNARNYNPALLSLVLGGMRKAKAFTDCTSGRTPSCRRNAPCQNGGQCLYSKQQYQCSCQRGFIGESCEIPKPLCFSGTCRNGGTCVQTATAYTCRCPPFYSGRRCQQQWFDEGKLGQITDRLTQHGHDITHLKASSSSDQQRAADRIDAFLRGLETRLTSRYAEGFANLSSTVEQLKAEIAGIKRTPASSSSPAVTPQVTSSGPSTVVRLVDGGHADRGRVEVFVNNVWGTVCDDLWTNDNAHVVCRQLGFQRAQMAVGGSRFGFARGQIWLDDVQCAGTEASLLDCEYKQPVGSSDCTHSEDAGVVCSYI